MKAAGANPAPPRALTRAGRSLALLLIFSLADLAALAGGFALAFAIRKYGLPEIAPLLRLPLQPFDWRLHDYLRFAPVALIWLAAFAAEGLYRVRRIFWEEARHLLRAATVAFIAILVLAFVFHVRDELSRPLVLLTFLLAALFSLALRRGLRNLLADSPLYARRLLLVAAPVPAGRLIALMERERSLGYRIAGVISDGPPVPPHGGALPLHPLEAPGDEVMALIGARDLLVATAGLPAARLAAILEETAGVAESVRILPDLAGLPLAGMEVESAGELPLLHVPQNLLSPYNLALKRLFDLVVALLLLPFLLPPLILLWLWIKLDSPGPALLRQQRLARGGGRFHCLKFRTMHRDADTLLAGYLKQRPEAAAEWETFQKLKGFDPRVTRAGRLIRKLSLDELPQLFNILAGQMSLAGPRPYLPREISTMGAYAAIILRARPGITGLWQVSGRNELPFAERLQLDEFYVRNWSLWLDLTLLLRTPAALLRGGAY
jgi:undecaprenyl-phosphate galactose phosphotransferase